MIYNFSIISISKQLLKPWNYRKIPTNLCWRGLSLCFHHYYSRHPSLCTLIPHSWGTQTFLQTNFYTIWSHQGTHAFFWYFMLAGHKIYFVSLLFFSNVFCFGSILSNTTSSSVKILSLHSNLVFKLTNANTIDNCVKDVHPGYKRCIFLLIWLFSNITDHLL